MGMKKLVLGLIFIGAATLSWAQKATDDFTGKWIAENKSVVTITKEGGYIVGHDEKGNKILYDIRFEDGEWIGRGKDPNINISGSCEIVLEGNRLKLRGGLGFIKTTHYFTRP
jgi:uncharacterized protein (DUF2147 family)